VSLFEYADGEQEDEWDDGSTPHVAD